VGSSKKVRETASLSTIISNFLDGYTI